MKISTIYSCSNCGYQSPKWLGRCPECEKWNSFSEEQSKAQTGTQKKIKSHARIPKEYDSVLKNAKKTPRTALGISEIDEVLGGGIVPGSLLLFTGEPGIGKSTLTLQIAEQLSELGKKVLYISGEESEEQISLRGERLGLKLRNLHLLSETNLETILSTVTEEKVDFLIVDSVQVISSQNIPGGAGSVSQVRLCTEAIMEYAKPKNLPVILIGHVTKDGNLAGPRVLEHLVDGVFMLEGERTSDLRLLRSMKNRFGSTNEVGVFEMKDNGLKQVANPSAKFLEERRSNPIGSALTCTLEGNRPFIVEVQALTSTTHFGYPKRTSSGFDLNRLNLLIAVMERHLKVPLGNQDIFVNVVGGLKLTEPAADLAIVVAILSSYTKKAFGNDIYVGEVGLSGEVRRVPQTEKRQKEAKKFNFALSLYSSISSIGKPAA